MTRRRLAAVCLVGCIMWLLLFIVVWQAAGCSTANPC